MQRVNSMERMSQCLCHNLSAVDTMTSCQDITTPVKAGFWAKCEKWWACIRWVPNMFTTPSESQPSAVFRVSKPTCSKRPSEFNTALRLRAIRSIILRAGDQSTSAFATAGKDCVNQSTRSPRISNLLYALSAMCCDDRIAPYSQPPCLCRSCLELAKTQYTWVFCDLKQQHKIPNQ